MLNRGAENILIGSITMLSTRVLGLALLGENSFALKFLTLESAIQIGYGALQTSIGALQIVKDIAQNTVKATASAIKEQSMQEAVKRVAVIALSTSIGIFPSANLGA